jgi:thymidylate synthase (FAD)
LAEHGHWSPFSHCFLQFRIEAPIFVARQLIKHQVGLAWNEVSRRYVDYTPKFYCPKEWRLKADNVKQGSSEDTVEENITQYSRRHVLMRYNRLLDKGIAAEMARMVLPQNMYTEWYWSGSLYAFSRVVNQRLDKTAQAETRYIADQISQQCARAEFKHSWMALTGEEYRSTYDTEFYITNQLPTDYQTFIATSRYARWIDEEGRRETWSETVGRFMDNIVKPSGVSDQDIAEI